MISATTRDGIASIEAGTTREEVELAFELATRVSPEGEYVLLREARQKKLHEIRQKEIERRKLIEEDAMKDLSDIPEGILLNDDNDRHRVKLFRTLRDSLEEYEALLETLPQLKSRIDRMNQAFAQFFPGKPPVSFSPSPLPAETTTHREVARSEGVRGRYEAVDYNEGKILLTAAIYRSMLPQEMAGGQGSLLLGKEYKKSEIVTIAGLSHLKGAHVGALLRKALVKEQANDSEAWGLFLHNGQTGKAGRYIVVFDPAIGKTIDLSDEEE